MLPSNAPPPIPITAYFFIDQADSFANAIGQSPPDFSFDCGGYECYAWVSRAGEALSPKMKMPSSTVPNAPIPTQMP